jgi:hypothetical protein
MFPLFGFNLRSLRIVSQSAPSLDPIFHGANVEVRPWGSADPEPVGRAGIGYAIAIYEAWTAARRLIGSAIRRCRIGWHKSAFHGIAAV